MGFGASFLFRFAPTFDPTMKYFQLSLPGVMDNE
jgi:hypothetical protein